MSKGTKEFKIDGDEFASVCHWQVSNGPLIIEVGGTILSISQAKKLKVWLDNAIKEVENDQKSRNIKKVRNSIVVTA